MANLSTRALKCGATLVAEVIPGVRSIGVTWFVPGGSADDPGDRLGRAAMLSELLMRGAGGRDSREMADAFDRIGAARSVDVGVYFMRFGLTALGSRLHDAIPMLADMVLRPEFEPDDVDAARDLALQAIASLKDDPQERATLAARARHYPSPLDRSGMGDAAGLNALTHEELLGAWRDIARPSRSIFAVAGAVDPDAVASDLDTLLRSWSGANTDPPVIGRAVRGYGHEPDETNQVQIILVHDAPAESHPDCVLEKLAVSVLSGGMSGRLFTEVREKRALCYAVSASYRADRDFGSISAYVGTTPEKAQESLDVLHAELVRIGTPAGRVTPEEFDRAVIGMKSRLVFSGESTAARAGAIASDMHRLGRPRSLDELTREIDAVTLDRVNDYLLRRPLGRLTVQTLGPGELRPPSGG
jgi:predicted Zn-dependent peptidase